MIHPNELLRRVIDYSNIGLLAISDHQRLVQIPPPPHQLFDIYTRSFQKYDLRAYQSLGLVISPQIVESSVIFSSDDVPQALHKAHSKAENDFLSKFGDVLTANTPKGQVSSSLDPIREKTLYDFLSAIVAVGIPQDPYTSSVPVGDMVEVLDKAVNLLVENRKISATIEREYFRIQDTLRHKAQLSYSVAKESVQKKSIIGRPAGKSEVQQWLNTSHDLHDVLLGYRLAEHMDETFEQLIKAISDRRGRLVNLPDNLPTDAITKILEGDDLSSVEIGNIVGLAEQKSSSTDFEDMSPDELMQWMESLAKRQGAAAEGFTTSASSAPVAEARFSAYSPREVLCNKRYGIYIYAYHEFYALAVEQDIEKHTEDLGGKVPKAKVAKATAELPIETPITVFIECDDLDFEPENLTKKWYGDLTKFQFDFRPSEELVGETVFLRVSIQVSGIEIAHIKTAMDVTQASIDDDTTHTIDAINPLMASKMKSQTVTPYQRIFISYSRRDSNVAKSYKIAQTALGNDAFLDVDNLRAGEDWRAALARAIDEADIFQLFWSEHSASSEYCRYEWDYALKVRCPDDNCEGFIRPVYWRRPMPSPPSELRRINFRFVPFEDQDD